MICSFLNFNLDSKLNDVTTLSRKANNIASGSLFLSDYPKQSMPDSKLE